MTYRVSYDICQEDLPTVEAGVEFLDGLSGMVFAHGRRAATYWFAPSDATDDVLRLDLDLDLGRAAMRWLPEDLHAVELDPDEPIVVLESSDAPLVTIPAALARVSSQTVRQSVIEYLSTGRRPTNVTWSR